MQKKFRRIHVEDNSDEELEQVEETLQVEGSDEVISFAS
jgi:hypothetical protein